MDVIVFNVVVFLSISERTSFVGTADQPAELVFETSWLARRRGTHARNALMKSSDSFILEYLSKTIS